MIERVKFRSRIYDFVKEEDKNSSENIFTVIVGKNGTGKSTLLSSIISGLLRDHREELFNQQELGFKNYSIKEFISGRIPDNIIAVSSSPFDKFPITKKKNSISAYSYLGLRDLNSINFSLSYMSKIISSLIDSINNNLTQWQNLSEVLNYLGYEANISAEFHFDIYKRYIYDFFHNRLFSDFTPGDLLGSLKHFSKSINIRFFLHDNGGYELGRINYLFEILSELINSYDSYMDFNKEVLLTINSYGVKMTNNSKFDFYGEKMTFLISSGILKLKDIRLIKYNDGSIFSIKDSSSGEQSVILSILGIASKITDNSIICIDEPEICLHPEWQEKYIQILIRTFRKFQYCHFIIATHSPQIVSNLSPKNCYIVSMEDAETNNARLFINNSIDFQLANVFKSPGFKNEYLSRIAFNLFSKVGKNKKFSEEDIENYKILNENYKILDDKDPVKELIDVVKELYKKYA